MLEQDVIELILNRALENGADFAEVFDEETVMQKVTGNQEEVEAFRRSNNSGVGIRLFVGKTCYYTALNSRDKEKLLEAVDQLLPKGREKNFKKVSLGKKQVHKMPEGTIYFHQLSAKEQLHPMKVALEEVMQYDEEICRGVVHLTDFIQKVQIANSDGLFVEDERVKTRLYVSAFAKNEEEMASGYSGPGAMMGREYYDTIDVKAVAREAARQAKVILHAKPCPGGPMPVVVEGGFGGLLFHEACGHSLEATVIAKNASEFCGKLGEEVASPVVTLVDDGSIPGEWGSLHVDDEGHSTQKNILIDQGVLSSYMVDRLNGLRGNLLPTGSSRRENYRFAPVARMTNTYIAQGNSNPKQMIADISYGLYVKSIIGGSVTPATGDFNFKTGECYLIENGQLTTPVKGATLIGNGGTILKRVDCVGDDFQLRQGFCYADSGALFIGAGQPTIRVSKMTVGGTI